MTPSSHQVSIFLKKSLPGLCALGVLVAELLIGRDFEQRFALRDIARAFHEQKDATTKAQ